MALRSLSSFAACRGLFARVAPVEVVQVLARPLHLEPTEALDEARAPDSESATARTSVPCNGTEGEATLAVTRQTESSFGRSSSDICIAMYAFHAFTLASIRVLKSRGLPPCAIKGTSSSLLNSRSQEEGLARGLLTTVHHQASHSFRSAFPASFAKGGNSLRRSSIQAHCQESDGSCSDISQNGYKQAYQFEISRSFATKGGKIKIKSYSSYKQRFWSTPGGGFKRMKAGKRHNASAKTKKQLRRLRTPTETPRALAKVMRKLGFQGR